MASSSSNFLRISVITPSYNQGPFIERTIQSVLNQDYPNLEFIVMDGGSTDETVDILKKYSGQLAWASERDRGQSNAINKGLRKATGDVLYYLNSDDLLLPGALHKVNRFFQTHKDSVWVTGYCINVNEQEKEIFGFITRYKDFLLRHFNRSTLLMINYICQMSTFWTREAYEKIGSFSEEQHLVMDYDYWLRLLALGKPGVIREPLSCFRIHNNAKSSQQYKKQFAESYQVASRYITSFWLRLASYLHNRLVILAYSLPGRGKKQE